jgi:hypothetical protein
MSHCTPLLVRAWAVGKPHVTQQLLQPTCREQMVVFFLLCNMQHGKVPLLLDRAWAPPHETAAAVKPWMPPKSE